MRVIRSISLIFYINCLIHRLSKAIQISCNGKVLKNVSRSIILLVIIIAIKIIIICQFSNIFQPPMQAALLSQNCVKTEASNNFKTNISGHYHRGNYIQPKYYGFFLFEDPSQTSHSSIENNPNYNQMSSHDLEIFLLFLFFDPIVCSLIVARPSCSPRYIVKICERIDWNNYLVCWNHNNIYYHSKKYRMAIKFRKTLATIH